MLNKEKIQQLATSAVQDYITKHVADEPYKMALLPSPFVGLEPRDLSNQVAMIQRAGGKLKLWANTRGLVFPELQAMEQCSSEATAMYKQKLIPKGATVVDLTGGFGVDSYEMSRFAQKLTYVEQQEYLCDLAKQNFRALEVKNIEVCHSTLEDYLTKWEQNPTDVVYCDPARRTDKQRKVFMLEDCSPNLLEIAPKILAKGATLIAKLSPLFDIHRLRLAFENQLAEVHVVAVKNECKELLVVLKPTAEKTEIIAVNLESGQPVGRFLAEAKTKLQLADEPQKYLYEPNAAIMKCGRVDDLQLTYPAKKIGEHSHLYTSEELIANFPGRIFTVQTVLPLSKKQLTELIPSRKANISCRNFPAKPEEISKKIGFSPGGDHYLFATTLANGKKVIVHCLKAIIAT